MNFAFNNVGFLAALAGTGGAAGNLIPDMTSATAPEGEASADSEVSTREAWRAMDRDDSTVWQASTSPPASWFLKYEFDSAQTAVRWAISADQFNQAPTDMKLQGSNDDAAWTDLDDLGGLSWTTGERKEWTFTNSTAYLYYRVLITDVPISTPRLRGFELFAS